MSKKSSNFAAWKSRGENMKLVPTARETFETFKTVYIDD